MSTDYTEFLTSKRIATVASGFDVDAGDLNRALFPFQRDIVHWALMRGKAALFQDCGAGKSIEQLSWAEMVVARQDGSVLILAPLAVSKQTIREAEKFGVEA